MSLAIQRAPSASGQLNSWRKPASRLQVVERLTRQAWEQREPRGRVIDEELFRGALIRERKRADRSNLPFLVLLVTLDDSVRADSSMQSAAADALLAAKREADVLGWFSQGAVLGIIFSEVVVPDASLVRRLEARVFRELARRFDADAVSRFSLRPHVHAGPMDLGPAPALVDPLLQTLRSRDGRMKIHDALKRALDIVLSFTLLAIFAPFLLIIAGLVKFTSRGPVLFKQVRVGQMATRFPMLKFRTMYSGADHGIHKEFVTQFIKASIPQAGGGEVFKLTNDARITAVGRVLRKTSLDELPQLWNVLRGDMSLVGPRPALAYEVEQYQPWHRRRVLEAKPGITGLWQVVGRSRTTFDEMVRLDLRYARTRSLWTDLKILLLTPSAVIAGRGAC